jgi:hypothetical protein
MAEKRITWDLLSLLINRLWAKIKANFTNKIEIVKVNGAAQTIGTDKSVNISVPIKLSQLANDKGFITKTEAALTNYYKKSETLSKTEINALISAIPKFEIKVVSQLPTTGISKTTIYLLKQTSSQTENLFTEYIRIADGSTDKWEKLGEQKLDLTGYLKETAADKKYLTLEGAKDIYAKKNGDATQPFSASSLSIGSTGRYDISVGTGGLNFKAGNRITTMPLAETSDTLVLKSEIPVPPEPVNSDDITNLLNSLQ